MRFYCFVALVVQLFPFLIPEATAQTPTAAPLAPAVMDTAIVELIMPEGAPSCLSVAISADTLGFGQVGSVKLKFSDSAFKPVAEDLTPSAPWLKLSRNQNSAVPGEVVFDIFVYRLNPFRIQVGSAVGPVVFMAGSLSDLSETAPIRMPRTWAARWWMLVLPALILTALVMGLWWLWQRRLRLEPLDQWAPAAPAWLQTSIDLKKLLAGDFPDLGTSRLFLDQLATISRGYLAARYLIHAAEMTSGEILAGCKLKGHDSRPLRRMIKILQELDHNRYDPEPPVASWCRLQASELLDAIEDVRILPHYTPVDAALLVEAEKAWSWLNLPENRVPRIAPVSGGEG